VFNHLDVEAERVDGFDPETAPYDKDGHYVLPGTLTVTTEASSTFKRETRGSAPSIGEADLKALADDPDHPEFTHADYLAMTEQTRVVGERLGSASPIEGALPRVSRLKVEDASVVTVRVPGST
jgi:hypothetical protein